MVLSVGSVRAVLHGKQGVRSNPAQVVAKVLEKYGSMSWLVAAVPCHSLEDGEACSE